jgi:hypothetical protein
MTRLGLQGFLALLFSGLCATTATAGPIEQACLRSDRKAVSLAACSCIQGVADFALEASDQRKVAGFFKDPERAEKARAADGKSDEAFWARYEAFGSQAEVYCGSAAAPPP